MAETAVGQYPIDTVNTMSNILEATEKHIKLHPHDSPRALKRKIQYIMLFQMQL